MKKLWLSMLATVAMAAVVGGVYARSPFYGDSGGGLANSDVSCSDNQVVTSDGTSGGTVQCSLATVSDAGVLTIAITGGTDAISLPAAGRVSSAHARMAYGLGTTHQFGFLRPGEGGQYVILSADANIRAATAAKLDFATDGTLTLSNAAGTSTTALSAGVGIATFSTALRVGRSIGTTVAEPVACDVNATGAQVYVDDTDDSAAGYICVCIGTGDDGAGAVSGYDWVRMDDHTSACAGI